MRRLALGMGFLFVLVIASCSRPTSTPPEIDNPSEEDEVIAPAPLEKDTTVPPFGVNRNTGEVVARDADGQVRWSTQLAGTSDPHRDPHEVWDARQVYVAHDRGVSALEAGTGKVLWHTEGPGDRLLLSGDLLLAADCASGRLLTARSAASGVEVFRIQLPGAGFDPEPIEEVAGLFLVQRVEAPGGVGDSLLIDRDGKVRHRLARQVVTGVGWGDNVVLLTSTNVVCLAPDDKVRWTVPFKYHQWLAGGGLVDLPGGDLLAFRYGCISDSGVDLAPIEPGQGGVVWQAHCASLGVSHSKYRHEAEVVVKGEKLRVTSRASGGTFAEALDLRTGRRLSRTGPVGERGE